MNTQLKKSFVDSLPLVASILGDKLGVSVELGGKCCTDGRTICLPLTLNERAITREELLGFVVHEASHIRFTTFENRGNSPILHEMVNAIEDARIEREICKCYGGALYLLKKSYEPMLETVAHDVCRMHPAGAYATYALSTCQSSLNDQFKKIAELTRARCVELFGQELMDKADQELSQFPQFRNTGDVRKCAERLIDLLADMADKQGNSTDSKDSSQSQDSANSSDSTGQQNDPQAQQSGQNSKSESASPQDSHPETASSQDSSSETADQDDKDGQSDQTADSGYSGNGDCQDRSATSAFDGNNARKALEADQKAIERPDLSERLRNKIDKARENPDDQFGVLPTKVFTDFSPTADRLRGYSPELVETIHKRGFDRINQAYADSASARRALIGAVQAKARTGYYTSFNGRKVDSSRLNRLMSGCPKIFERREEVRAVDTAVSVLLDLSGSVSSEQELAIRASLALMAALRSISFVKASLTVFPSTAAYSCANNGTFAKVVPFGDTLEKHVDIVGLLKSQGWTPLVETVVGACAELSQRKEQKRVIFVVTDGDVDAVARRVLQELKHPDCITVGIRIGNLRDDKFDGCFDISEQLSTYSELQAALMRISQKMLLGLLS